jgi:hypothetical protein
MTEKVKPGRKAPPGDRRRFLTTISTETIKAVKQAALDDDTTAGEIMDEAAKQWLQRRKSKSKDA